MTRSDNSLRDLHLSSRPPVLKGGADMGDDYWGYRRPGWKQLLCAWFIVLTVATLFRITDLISPNRTVSLPPATDLAQTADVEQTGDIEHWERGVPRRQWTIIVPSDRKIIMVSHLDQ